MKKRWNISPIDRSRTVEIQTKIDGLNKPKGSMGRLEEIALQLCLIQNTLSPSLRHPCHLLLGGDHGIEREGVSVSPREVTWQQMINFTQGGGGVNMFCRQHGFHLRLVDMGVDHDLSAFPNILPRKVAWGTADFRYGPAMTAEQCQTCLDTGAALVDDCVAEGCQVLAIGEMGVGNTSPSSLLMSELGALPLTECVGAGAGLNSIGIRHKLDILQEAQKRFHHYMELQHLTTEEIPIQLIAYCCGFEMVAAIGAMLRAAEQRLVVMVDGFIMTACMLAASKLNATVLDYAIFGHCGDEGGHKKLLQLLHARPLLQLGLRLGEGTGALCAFPLVDSAARMMNEMNDFDHAHITKYF